MADPKLVNAVLDSIVGHESGGKNIRTQLTGSAGRATAQGFFQYTNGTWRSAAKQAGVTGYPTAMSAPYEVQRKVAYADVARILDSSRGDVRAVPRVWYVGHNTLGKASDNVVPRPEYGNKLTPAQYSAGWMKRLERSMKGENVMSGSGGGGYSTGGSAGPSSPSYDHAALGRGAYAALSQKGLDPTKFNIYLRDGNVYARPIGG